MRQSLAANGTDIMVEVFRRCGARHSRQHIQHIADNKGLHMLWMP